jgi:predicted ATPase/tetratricopeptide (TPR) repeat protein
MEPQDIQPIVIRTPDHRLRVFVSSTLRELAVEREAVRQVLIKLHLTPVMFESGARPHPAQKLYRAYLAQSHIFIGIYWQSYGWIAPGKQISGLEDEYNLAVDMPCLIYIKTPAPNREPSLERVLERIRDENTVCYKSFTTPAELGELMENDLMLLLTEYFETARSKERVSREETKQLLTNIPVPRNPLIGREQELKAACDLLLRDDVALVTLTGTSGTGKSRLGIQIALEMQDHFADGVYLVELESINNPDRVIPAIANTLAVKEVAGGQPLIETLINFLRTKQVLLLLDNFEHILAAAPKIAELLEACPQTKILVTSRAPLHLRPEREFPVSSLAIPPEELDPQLLIQYASVELFVQRAQGIKPDFHLTYQNALSVAKICQRLDGLPLAIELASARIRMLSPQALLARLQHGFEVLRGGTRDLPERQQTMYSAIDWSYNLLTDECKRLLRRLSVFVGSWTLESAEAVCNFEDEEGLQVYSGLEILVDNNLLKPPEELNGEIRFKMLETIHSYTHDRLIESGESELIQFRHMQYFMHLVEKADVEKYGSDKQYVWRKRLEAELDNLRAAMGWTLEQRNFECELRITTALWRFWWTHGYWREGLQWLELGLVGGESIPDAVRAKALTRMGWLIHKLGDNPRAIKTLREGLELWREINDPAGIALTLSNLGGIVLTQGDYAGAIAMLEEALQLRQELSDQRGVCATLMNIGLAVERQGDNERAIELYSESLVLARTIEDDYSLGIALINLGVLRRAQGAYQQAEACFVEAESVYQRLGDRAGVANSILSQGLNALKRGDYSQAFDLMAEAIMVLQELGEKRLTLVGVWGMAVLAKERDQLIRATRLFSAYHTLYKAVEIISPTWQAESDSLLVSLRNKLDEPAFNAAWSEGSEMSLEESVSYALEKFENG